MALKCIVFDCDGVILDSVPIKTNAFAKIAEPYGTEAKERMIMYHTIHGGVNRFKKFEWFYNEILGQNITAEESEELGKKFNQYVMDELRTCPLIPGIMETLNKWYGKLSLYVCTGAPTDDTRFILKERGIDNFFDGIYGAPPAKAKTLAQIINEKAKIMPTEAVMIGDSTTDRDAAESVGTLFYGIGQLMKGNDIPWSIDLVPLNNWLEKQI